MARATATQPDPLPNMLTPKQIDQANKAKIDAELERISNLDDKVDELTKWLRNIKPYRGMESSVKSIQDEKAAVEAKLATLQPYRSLLIRRWQKLDQN